MNGIIFLCVFFASVTLSCGSDTVKIEIIDLPADCKVKAKNGDKATMHYDGTLKNGKPFDSSRSRNSPFTFQLGTGQVILCWDQGIPGMCIGEKRRLTCPPEYAYGDKAMGDVIPAKSTLVFEVELLDIAGAKTSKKTETKKEETKKEEAKKEEPKTEATKSNEHEHQHPDSFESIDKDKNGEVSREEMVAYIKGYQDDDDSEEAEKPSDEELTNLVSDIFQTDDTNKDGVLSKEEYEHGEAGDESMEKEMDPEDLKRDEL